MEYGFGIPTRGPLATPADIAAIALAGEAAGFATLTVNDHIVLPHDIGSRYPYSATGEWPGGGVGDWLEPLGLLCHLAGITKRVRLLTAVLVIPYRPVLLQAKLLTTIDVLSEGRLTIGCGVGWMREEFEALGAPPFEERGRVADEYLAAFRELWTKDEPQFDGEYVDFTDIAFAPKPVQKPHPPFWIGGESAPALRRAATIGDGWFPIGSNPQHPLDTPERLEAALADLDRRAEAAGRNPASITRAYSAPWFSEPGSWTTNEGGRRVFTGSAQAITDDIGRFRELGVDHLILGFNRPSRNEVIERMESFMKDVAAKA
jgi:probable F420-dependent oxidoreductase